MDAREETLYILRNIWLKLQDLPNASTIELGGFLVILTFILVVLLMAALTCVNYYCCCCCCCCRKTKVKGSNI